MRYIFLMLSPLFLTSACSRRIDENMLIGKYGYNVTYISDTIELFINNTYLHKYIAEDGKEFMNTGSWIFNSDYTIIYLKDFIIFDEEGPDSPPLTWQRRIKVKKNGEIRIIDSRDNDRYYRKTPPANNNLSHVNAKAGCLETTVKFLNWYKSEYDKLNSILLIQFIEIDSTKFYRINFESKDTYLDLLASSGYFSRQYLDSLNNYFILGDKKLLNIRQNDGPPEGFEYDLILLTQEPEEILNNISSVNLQPIHKADYLTTIILDNNLVLSFNGDCQIVSINRKPLK